MPLAFGREVGGAGERKKERAKINLNYCFEIILHVQTAS